MVNQAIKFDVSNSKTLAAQLEQYADNHFRQEEDTHFPTTQFFSLTEFAADEKGTQLGNRAKKYKTALTDDQKSNHSEFVAALDVLKEMAQEMTPSQNQDSAKTRYCSGNGWAMPCR